MDDKAAVPEPQRLRAFTPFQALDDTQLVLLAGRASVEQPREGAVFLDFDSQADGCYFLLDGVVEIEARDGNRRIIEGGSDKAAACLNPENPCNHSITALSPVTLLRVGTELMNQLQLADHATDQLADDDDPAAHPLLRSIREDLRTNRFSLPSLPEVALRIRKALDNDDASIARITKIVNADPAITAKLIKAANSPLYRGGRPIESCQAAIVRLGMNTTRQLVISFTLHDLFRIKDPALRKRMQQSWRNSTETAAICMMLAQLTTHLEPEQALLAGLVHDIGVPAILAHLQQHQELSADGPALEQLLLELRGEVGGTILRHWQFSDALVQAAISCNDWQYESGGNGDYCDLVIIARLHQMMKSGRSSDHPPFDMIPAYGKLGPDALTPQTSIRIIDEAREQVGELIKLLAA